MIAPSRMVGLIFHILMLGQIGHALLGDVDHATVHDDHVLFFFDCVNGADPPMMRSTYCPGHDPLHDTVVHDGARH